MFTNLTIRTSKLHHRKSGVVARGGIAKRRVSLVPASAVSNVPTLSFMEDLFGDEFPEAFSNGEVRLEKSRKSLLDLPAELLAVICDHLPKVDIKRLRLTSKYLSLNVDLRLDRVYVSPNQANLNCLQRILEHSRYRNCVREIVWDDAQLEEYSTLEQYSQALSIDERKVMRDVERRLDEAMEDYPDDSQEYHSLDDEDFFSDDGRLTDVAKGILLETNDRVSRDIIARNAAVMSIEESYLLYQRLYQEEQDLMKRQVDVKALHRALVDFPGVHKITLTSEVWRPWNLYPEYDTPFYRALPPGFRKPSVWPWLGPQLHPTPAQDAYRNKIMGQKNIDWLSDDWRGYGIIVAALLNLPGPKIDEFIIDAGNERTGISHQLFLSENLELERTIRMLQYVPIKRFHLALNPHNSTGSQTNSNLSPSLFERTLREMQHLEHLEFNPNLHFRRQRFCAGLFEISSIMSEELVKRLKTFNLRNMPVFQEDLLKSLLALESVEKITLDNLMLAEKTVFSPIPASWESIFWQLREQYSNPDWPFTRPKYTWIDPVIDPEDEARHCLLLDEEIDMYLYAGGEAPFYHHTNRLTENVGWIIDERDKSFRIRRWDRPSEVYLDPLSPF